MEVVVDGEAGWVTPGETELLGAVLDSLRTGIDVKNRSIVAVTLDGEELNRARQDELASDPTEKYSLLEIRTVDPYDLSHKTLKGLIKHLDNMEQVHKEAAELVRGGEYKYASEKLEGCFAGWEVIIRAISDISSLCSIDFEKEMAGEKTIHEHVKGLQGSLKDFREAFNQGDVVTVADVADHRLAAAIGDWRTVVRSLSEIVSEASGPSAS